MENVEDVFHKKAAENDKRFEKLLKKEMKKKSRKEVRHPMFYRVATFAAVFLLIFDVCVFTVPAIRSAMVDFINRVTGEYTNILVNKNDEDVVNKEPVDEKEFGFDKEYKITYIPDGMVLSDYSITSVQINYVYIGADESNLSMIQEKSSFSTNIDTENAIKSTIYINGNEAMIVEKGETVSLIYSIDKYTIRVESRGISKEILVKIAKSIKEFK